MKNLTKILASTLSLILIIIGISFAENIYFPYTWITIDLNEDTDYNKTLKTDIWEPENWLYKLLHLFMPNSEMYDGDQNPSFIFYLKTIVNLLLSFVSFIALIFLIYAFYMIFFRKDEAGTTTAKQMVKWIFIALVVIWLSRIIVSFLYRFEKENTQDLGYKPNNTKIVTSLT